MNVPFVERSEGDSAHGWTIALDPIARIVRARLWGLWTPAIAQAYLLTFREVSNLLKDAPWCILADSRGFMAQAPEIADIRQKSMAEVGKLNCIRIASIAKSAAYAMQFNRIGTASHMQTQAFLDEVTAKEWLTEGIQSGTVRVARAVKRR
jgi:hypothetical protein